MTDILSLEQLVHLSLGDPEAGAVNFNVLKTLLLQMLKAMNLFNHKPMMSDDDQRRLKEALSTSTTDGTVHTDDHDRSSAEDELERKRRKQRVKRDQSSDRLNLLEEKVFRFESQLNALDHIPSNSQLIDRAKQVPKKTSNHDDHAKGTNHHRGPILEVWQYTQMEKRIESAENGITRVEENSSIVLEPILSCLARFVAARSSVGNERSERLERSLETIERRPDEEVRRTATPRRHAQQGEERLGRLSGFVHVRSSSCFSFA